MKRALITGITGQDGLYLSELLLAKGYEVFGLIRGQNNPKADLVRRTVPDVTLLTGDITDLASLIRAFGEARPDETEDRAVRAVPFAEAVAMAASGEISDAFSALALLRAWYVRGAQERRSRPVG